MADRTSTLKERMKHSGKNPSELKCEEFYSKRKNSFILIRYGLDQWANPDMTWNNWEKIKPFIRKTPDYIIVSKEKNQSYLLEVKSAKETFMLKKEDWEQYDKWDWIDSDEDNLIFYIYDFESKTQKHVKMSKIRKIVKSGEYKWEWIDEDTPRPKEVMYIPFELL